MNTRLILACVLTAFAFQTNAANAVPEKDRKAEFLSWLGAVPPGLRMETLSGRMDRVVHAIQRDLSTASSAANFECKTPAQVGPVPMMDAVERYIDGMPASGNDQAMLIGLDEAARRGNWLARVQLYAWLSERAGQNVTLSYRQIQLMEWMQEEHIGALYAFFGEDLAASGYYSDSPGGEITGIDLYAAMHNSFPAQNKVGKYLVSSDHPSEVLIGKKMLACASGALPAYARVFSSKSGER